MRGHLFGAVRLARQHAVGVDGAAAPEYVRTSPWTELGDRRGMLWEIAELRLLPRAEWAPANGNLGTWPLRDVNVADLAGRLGEVLLPPPTASALPWPPRRFC